MESKDSECISFFKVFFLERSVPAFRSKVFLKLVEYSRIYIDCGDLRISILMNLILILNLRLSFTCFVVAIAKTGTRLLAADWKTT